MKNLMEIRSRSLVGLAIDCARESKLITSVWVTTEDRRIAEEAKRYGANVLGRPVELALDDTPMHSVINHARWNLPEHDYICLLQPTSPNRTPDVVDSCIQTAALLAKAVATSNDGKRPNGAVYVWPWTDIKTLATTFYEYDCVDIDTMEDFKKAEAQIG